MKAGRGRPQQQLVPLVLLVWLRLVTANVGGSTSPPPYIPPEVFQTPPVDCILYERLEVAYNASSRDIQRSYRRLAVRLHPDKHGGDPALSEQFKQVVEAYETLSCDEARARYHLYGPQHQHLMPQHQHQHQQQSALEVTLRQHFGGGRFEPLVGELPNNYLLVPGPGGVSVETFDYEGRLQRLAEALVDRLQLRVTGQVLEWERLMFEEAQSLRHESMGPQMLASIGYVYERCGRRFLSRLHLLSSSSSSSPWPRYYHWPFSNVANKAHVLGTYMSAMGSSVRLLYQLKAHHHKRAAGGPAAGWQDPQVLPSLLDALWRLHRCDMERTVKEACKRVLRDPSQTVATLEARAHALVSLGRIFTAAARLPPPPPDGY